MNFSPDRVQLDMCLKYSEEYIENLSYTKIYYHFVFIRMSNLKINHIINNLHLIPWSSHIQMLWKKIALIIIMIYV